MTGLPVVDTTVWSNFAHAGDPTLVTTAFAGAASPREVLDEIARGQRLGFIGTYDWSFIRGDTSASITLPDELIGPTSPPFSTTV